MDTKDRVYSSAWVAAMLGIRIKSVSKNAKAWGIGEKIGGNYMFSMDDIKMFKRKHRRRHMIDKRSYRQRRKHMDGSRGS